MHTASPTSRLAYWCRKVSEMRPGQRMEVQRHDLDDIPALIHNEATFTPALRILGNIVGSAYTHSFHVRPDNGSVVFECHENTGERRYHDPDDDYRIARLARSSPVTSL